MEKWSEEAFKSLSKRMIHEIEHFEGYIETVKKVAGIAEKILREAHSEVPVPTLDGIMDELTFWSRDTKPVHEIARILGIKLERQFSDALGQISFVGKYLETKIKVFVVKVAKCKIVKRKRKVPEQKVTYFELVCNEEDANKKVQ